MSGCWYSEASRLYPTGELDEVVLSCLSVGGVVHCDSECFFCAIETESKKGLDFPDTWLICIAAGDTRAAFSHIEPRDYIAFERFDGRLRIYEWERFRRKIWVVRRTRF